MELTLTDRSLTFLDQEISLRKEQKEYLSDVESPHKEFHGKSRELYLKLVSEIEVLERLKFLAICDKQGREFSSRRMIVPKPSSEKSKDGSELHAYLNDEAGQKATPEDLSWTEWCSVGDRFSKMMDEFLERNPDIKQNHEDKFKEWIAAAKNNCHRPQ